MLMRSLGWSVAPAHVTYYLMRKTENPQKRSLTEHPTSRWKLSICKLCVLLVHSCYHIESDIITPNESIYHPPASRKPCREKQREDQKLSLLPRVKPQCRLV